MREFIYIPEGDNETAKDRSRKLIAEFAQQGWALESYVYMKDQIHVDMKFWAMSREIK